MECEGLSQMTPVEVRCASTCTAVCQCNIYVCTCIGFKYALSRSRYRDRVLILRTRNCSSTTASVYRIWFQTFEAAHLHTYGCTKIGNPS